MLIALGCLWVSHYVLELTSPLAEQPISTNVARPLHWATAFRFTFYRMMVFTPTGRTRLRAPEAAATPSSRAPLAGVQYVAPVENRTLPHDRPGGLRVEVARTRRATP